MFSLKVPKSLSPSLQAVWRKKGGVQFYQKYKLLHFTTQIFVYNHNLCWDWSCYVMIIFWYKFLTGWIIFLSAYITLTQ